MGKLLMEIKPSSASHVKKMWLVTVAEIHCGSACHVKSNLSSSPISKFKTYFLHNLESPTLRSVFFRLTNLASLTKSFIAPNSGLPCFIVSQELSSNKKH